MTATVKTRRQTYDGNGVSVLFGFDFEIFDATDLTVRLVDQVTGVPTTQVYNVDYTVQGVGTDTGGSITFVTAPGSDVAVDISGDTPLTQPTSFRNQGRFLEESHERVADRMTALIQQLSRKFGRAVRLPDRYEPGTEPDWDTLLSLENRKGKYALYFDAVTGEPELFTQIETYGPLTQAIIGQTLYPQTAAEVTAGVTPTYYQYPPGHGSRYGMNPAAASNTDAFDDAAAVCQVGGYELVLAPGFYYFTSRPAPFTNKITIRAEGSKGTVILFRDYNEATPTNGFITSAPVTEIASLKLAGVYLYANTGTTGGAAIALIANSASAPDYSIFEDMVITGLSGGTWEYTVYADGSLRASALRDVEFRRCICFNATTALAYFKSVVNLGLTQTGFYPGAGTSNNVVITGTASIKTQNVCWMGGYFEDLDLDYCRHVNVQVADPVQAITNTADVDYTIIQASYAVSCETDWDKTSCMLVTPKILYRNPMAISADRGDANRTLTAGTEEPIQRFATELTANRTVTLSTTGAVSGDRFRIVRTGLGAFTLDVGGLKTIPSATAAFVDVSYNGSAWVLTGYGAL